MALIASVIEDEKKDPLNEFDAFVDEEIKSSEIAQEADEFDLFINNEESAHEALSSSLEQSLPENPQQVAKQRDLSERSGIPEDIVKEDPATVEQQLKKDEIVTALDASNSPATRRFLSNPDNAKISHDEVESLIALETRARDVTFLDSVNLGVDQVQGLLYGAVEAFSKASGLESLGQLAEEGRIANREESRRTAEDRQKFLDIKNIGQAANFVKESIGQTAPSVGLIMSTGAAASMMAAAAGTVVVAPAVAGLMGVTFMAYLLGVGSIQSSIQEAEPGVEGKEDIAITGGVLVGLLDSVVPGRLGSQLMQRIGEKGVMKAVTEILKNAGKEGVRSGKGEFLTEASQETLQDLFTNKAVGREFNLEETGRNSIEAGASAFFGGGSFGVGTSVISDVAASRRAQRNQEVMDDFVQKVQELETTKRDIGTAIEFEVELLKEQKIEDIFIPVENLLEFSESQEGVTSAEFIEEMGLTEQVKAAQNTQGDVRLSQRQFAEFITLSENYNTVSEHIRYGEGEMTAAEAKEYETSELPEALKALSSEEVDGEITLTKQAPKIEGEPTVEQKLSDIEKEVKEDIELAREEAGLKALFDSAEEAGQTEKQYEGYLKAVQQAAEAPARKELLRREKRKLREAKEELKEQTIDMRRIVQEEVLNRPEYKALELLKQGGKLDQQAIFESDFLGEPFDLATLNEFPKIGNKKIYGPKGKGEVYSPDLLAEIVGLPDGESLLKLLINARPIEDVIIEEADARVAIENQELPQRIQDLEAAIESIYVDDVANVLAIELNALRDAKKQGRIKPALIRKDAQNQLQYYNLRDISPTRFAQAAKRFGRLAGRLLRKGDRSGSTEAKFRQLINFQMAREAYAIREKRKADEKFLKKAAKKPSLRGKKAKDLLPPDYSTAIRHILHSHGLPGKAAPADFDMAAFHQAEKEQGISFKLPPPGNPEINPLDLTLHDWNTLVNAIKEIQAVGIAKTKFLRNEKKEEVQKVVNELVVQVHENLEGRSAKPTKKNIDGVEYSTMSEHLLDKISDNWDKYGPDLATLGFNMDTLVRELDNFEDLGKAYEAIKGPIDRAISDGYQEGQIGYTERLRKMSDDVVKLFKDYTEKDYSKFNRKLNIPGIRTQFTRRELIGILLHSGNQENITAMEESGQVTKEELEIIRNAVPKKDLEFAQSVWDYLDTYWEDIVESTVRRKNFKPEKIVALPFEAQGESFKGGYMPLRYSGDSLTSAASVSLEELQERVLYGEFTSQHTKDGHIQARVGSGGREVVLDPFTLVSHLERVIYDLEVGEALADSYKVLHHRDFKQAFSDIGRMAHWDAMDLWFRDVVTGEIRRGDTLENAFRHIRSGVGVVALGWNFSVASLQLLGMVQTAAQIGTLPVLKSLTGITSNIAKGNFSVFTEIGEKTGTMRNREFTYNKDTQRAHQIFKEAQLNKGWKGKAKEIFQMTFFIAIAKLQRVTDVVTWQAAYSKGMKDFHNNDKKAREFADRMVIRTQGSGNFHERTPVERGTISKGISQTEMVRSFSLFINFFAAKMNILYEKTKKTNLKDPKQFIDLASNIVLLFVVETAVAMLMRDRFPDDDEENEDIKALAKETASTFFQGVPIVREAITSARGFDAGGAIGAFAGNIGDMLNAMGEEEIDDSFWKSSARVFGTLTHLPAGQAIKSGRAFQKAEEGDDVSLPEYFLGPKE